MKRTIERSGMSGVAAFLLAGTFGGSAQSLHEIGVNVNGNWSDWVGQAAPTAANATSASFPAADLTGVSFNGSFNTDRTGTGLGTIQYSVASPGNYNFSTFLDIEANPNNVGGDIGTAHGTPTSGQTWEIGAIPVDGIFEDFQAHNPNNTLLNGFALPDPSQPVDIATAMGFNFNLPAGDTATVDLVSSGTAPTSGFYLQQTADNGNSVYLYGSLEISPTAEIATVPDCGSTLSAMTLALAGLAGFKYKLERNPTRIVNVTKPA